MTVPDNADNGPIRRLSPSGAMTVSQGPWTAPTGAGAWTDAQTGRDTPVVVLASLWRVLFKHRLTILGAIVACLAVGIAATLLTAPQYTAETTLQIDREAEKVVSGEDLTPTDNLAYGEEFFQTQYGLLRSRALAVRVAESLGLARDEAFVASMTGQRAKASRAHSADERRDLVIKLLQSNVGIVPERGSRLVAVAFSSPEPELSARVANAFAEDFIASAIERRFESSSYARDFLERRLAQVKAKLEDSERQLVAYAAGQQIIQLSDGGQPHDPEAGKSLASADLEAFNTALAAARTERIRAEQRWREAQSGTGLAMSDILQSPTIQAISQEHAKLVAQYQDRLSVYKPDYPDMRQLKSRIDETERQLKLEASDIRESLHGQYLTALNNEASLARQVNSSKSSVLDLRGRSIRYNILQREVDTNRTLYDGLLQRYKEVGVSGGVSPNNISIVDRAEAPRWPSRPKPLFNILTALVGGAVIGVGLAFLREAFDQAVRTPADIETGLGLPLLGTVPSLKKGVRASDALKDARSPMAEAHHSLRSALQFSTADGFPKTMLVTSPWPGGGKSTTAFAVARNVSRLGYRVLIIDGDLRSPSLDGLLEIDNRLGLSNILTGANTLKEATKPTDLPSLFAVTSGPPPPNPAELLAGVRLRLLIAEASAQFDMVIFDGPPIMALADAPMIASVVAGALLVVESRRTTRAQVRASLQRLAQAGGHILGAVLTRYDAAPTAYGYGYGYGYEYGADHPPVRTGTLSAAARSARRLVGR